MNTPNRRERPIRWILCLAISLVVLAPLSTSASGAAPEKVSLQLLWVPQAQFAGYMMALEKGFYRQVGLNVQMRTGGPSRPPMEALMSKQATFCIDWLTNAIKNRAYGVDVVNVGQVVQRSGLTIVAKKKLGIKRLEDLNGKKLGIWSAQFAPQIEVLLRRGKIEVEKIPNYSSCALLLKGGVAAMAAMLYNEYHTILNSGLTPDELVVFRFSDEALNFPEDGIYCLEETAREKPKVCADFVRASLRGWTYAFEHEEETVDVVMRRAAKAYNTTNRAHQRWMLARMKDLILPKGRTEAMGVLKESDYLNVARTLMELDLIKEIPSFREFYRGPR